MGLNFRRNALPNSRVFREKSEERANKKAQLAQIKQIREELQIQGWNLVIPKQAAKELKYVIVTTCGKRIDACYNYVAKYTRYSGSIESLWTKAIEKMPVNFSQKQTLS